MNKRIRIHFSTGVKYNGVYYLMAIHMNALFMYDEKKDKLTLLTRFKKERKSNYLYLKAFLYKNEAWFIPYQADYIAIVNLDTYTIKYISLEYQKCFDTEGIKYINILHFSENFLCLIPWAVDTMMIVDLQSKKATAYYNFVDRKRNYQNAIFFNNKIYFFPWKAKDILILDLKTGRRIGIPLKIEEESFGDVVYDEKSERVFHAPARENYILIDSLNGEVYEKIKLDYWNDKEYKTYYSTEGKDDIFFWGQEKNVVLKVNKHSKNVEVFPITPLYSQKYFYPICSNEIEALVYDGSCIIKFNMDKNKFTYLYISTTLDILIDEMNLQEQNFLKIGGKNFFHESEDWDLLSVLYCLFNSTKIKSNRVKKNVGKQIYNSIKIT